MRKQWPAVFADHHFKNPPTRYPDYEAILEHNDDELVAAYAELEPEINDSRIHVSEPVFLGNESAYVNDCLERRWLTQGLYVGRLEAAFAEFCGTRFAVSCSSGTAALHLALLALDLEPGDFVLVPALTYVATANAVKYCGATPVFCDVERDTWCLDPADVKRKAQRVAMLTNQHVKGAIAVHLFNAMADLDAIRDALPDEAWLLEDAAQAHGGIYRGRRAGATGIAGTFSFYGSKVLTTGEGGIVVTDNQVLAEKARLYRGQGADRSGRYEHSVIGYNYRLTDIGAAIGLAQLETYDEHARRRREVVAQYRKRLEGNELGIELQAQRVEGAVPADWSVGVILPRGANRDAIAEALLELGVETRPFFVPLPALTAYRDEAQPVPAIAAHVAGRGLTLPTHAGMSSSSVDKVVDSLVEVLS
jgi:perosamine synthetase